jgi:uncharacterized membrane protein (UPF0127 family)
MNEPGGRIVCERCVVADKPYTRMRGLLGRSELAHGEGLLLRPAPSVHTCFMRFPIDAVFLDRRLRVLSVSAGLRPWRFAGARGSRAVLELAAGEAGRRGICEGVTLRLIDSQSSGEGAPDKAVGDDA